MTFFSRFYYIILSTFLLSSCFPNFEELNLHWVTIEGGSFQMGSSEGESDELPIHTVTVSTFEITQTEVTVAQYRACVEVGVCSEPDSESTYWEYGSENHPINYVNWVESRTFAQWVGGDLPSEAQWEYAARGGDGGQYEYAGSDAIDDVAWYDTNESRPVGQKAPNGYGLYDMSGNVREWVLDEYESSYEGVPTDGSPRCSRSDCLGTEMSLRTRRGGSIADNRSDIRITNRTMGYPSGHSFSLGFRIVRLKE